MVDPIVAAAPSFINWTLNVWDILMIAACAALLYSRLTTLETKIEPLWVWWNDLKAGKHSLGV